MNSSQHPCIWRAAIIVVASFNCQLADFRADIQRRNPLRCRVRLAWHRAAFKAYTHACRKTGISPDRLTQTIGDSPRSFGYHLKDGTLKVNGQRIDYCAATDFRTSDLSPAQIVRFVRALDSQGFAVWYRHGGKWQGSEHIHAVYALLPMKAQLRRQVRLYLREEKPDWARKWRQRNR